MKDGGMGELYNENEETITSRHFNPDWVKGSADRGHGRKRGGWGGGGSPNQRSMVEGIQKTAKVKKRQGRL